VFAGASVSVDPGRYFLTGTGVAGAASFLAHFKSKLDAATGRTWTLALDDTTDSATGSLTMAVSGAATTGTWSSTAIRNILGFDTNLSSGTSWTGNNNSKVVWLPNCGRSGAMSPQGTTSGYAARGAGESDASFTLAPSGAAYSIGYTVRYMDTLEFRTVTGNKMWYVNQAAENESLQVFWETVISKGLAVRYFPDRSDDSYYRTFRIENFGEFKPIPVIENWTDSANSLWGISYRVRDYV
jgi:hypothetical protein